MRLNTMIEKRSRTTSAVRSSVAPEALEARRLFAVVFDSQGFESPRYDPGPLEDQDPIGPWLKDTVRTGVATVQTATVESGLQAVEMTRPAAINGDTRYAVRDLVLPNETLDVIRVNWDMNVPANAQPFVDFGPFFGVEAYDDQTNNTGAPKLIGSLGVDASTGDVLYQDGTTGVFTESGFDITFGQWHHFTLELDYTTETYTVFVDGVSRASTGFVDDSVIGFTDAPLAALAASAGSIATATGNAFFDNYRIDIGQAIPQVQAVYVRGVDNPSTGAVEWAGPDINPSTTTFGEFLEAQGLGDAVYGLRVDNLPASTTIPFINANQVVLQYSDPISAAGIPTATLVLDGQQSDYTVIAVGQLDPRTVVLTLDRALGIQPAGSPDPTLGDRVKLSVPSAGPGGTPYRVTLNVLQGDADRLPNKRVGTTDINFVKARLNTTSSNPGTSGAIYSVFADLDASGRINTTDINAAKARLNDVLPPATAAAGLRFSDSRIAASVLA